MSEFATQVGREPTAAHMRRDNRAVETRTPSFMNCLRFLALAALALAAPAVLAQQPAADCVIVYSQGRSASGADPKANQMWNTLNDAFGQFVAEELERKGRRVVPLPHPVEAADKGLNTDRILKAAAEQHCDTAIVTSMFADQQRRAFVSSMRVLPIVANKVEAPAGTSYSLGPAHFGKEQADPLTRETLDRLVPDEIAKNLVGAFLAERSK